MTPLSSYHSQIVPLAMLWIQSCITMWCASLAVSSGALANPFCLITRQLFSKSRQWSQKTRLCLDGGCLECWYSCYCFYCLRLGYHASYSSGFVLNISFRWRFWILDHHFNLCLCFKIPFWSQNPHCSVIQVFQNIFALFHISHLDQVLKHVWKF